MDSNGISEENAADLFKQLIYGLDYCHRKRISNRDIELENMLLDASGTHLKICDFGLSINHVDSPPKSKGVGTHAYFGMLLLDP